MADELWMIVAVIQPFKLDSVTLALENVAGFVGVTVSDCRGFGRGKLDALSEGVGNTQRPPSAGLTDFTSKVRLEIAVVGRQNADAVMDVLLQAAHTGRPGDGKIFFWPIAGATRIRTRQSGAEAL